MSKFWKLLMGTLFLSLSLNANSLPRVVSLNGTITEIIFALGAGETVVGCDTSSLYPERANKLPKIGYQRAVSAEGILSLNPSLILGTNEAGPPNTIQQLQTSKKKISVFQDKPELDHVWKKIAWVGEQIGKSKEAKSLIDKLKKDYQVLRTKILTTNKPSVLFIYSRGQGTILVSGKNTAASEMIELAGGKNAIMEFEGFKPLTPESLAGLQVDFILIPTKALESLGGKEGLKKVPGLLLTKAGKQGKIIDMDDLFLLGFSTRIVSAIEELGKLIGTIQ